MEKEADTIYQAGIAQHFNAGNQVIILQPNIIIGHGIFTDGTRIGFIQFHITDLAAGGKTRHVGALMKYRPQSLMNILMITFFIFCFG